MDHKTLFVVLVSVFQIQAVALYQTWSQNREEIGIRDWAVAAVLMSIGCVLAAIALYFYPVETALSASDRVTGILLRSAGNAFGASGWFLVWVGVRHFYQRNAVAYRNIVLFAVFFGLLMALQAGVDLFSGWTGFWVSVSFAIFAALTLYEFIRRHRRINAIVGVLCIALLAMVVIWSVRALTYAGIGPPGIQQHDIYVISLYSTIVASVTVTVSMILLTNDRINIKLMNMAHRDPLTGAMNRRAFKENTRLVTGDARYASGGNSLCLIDLDHFKMINDNYGHATGDLLLAHFSALAMNTMREGDLFARYGGEEFVVLLNNCTIETAEARMEQLRRTWEQQTFEVEGKSVSNTLSVGIVQIDGDGHFDLDKVLGQADKLLYQAKESGRNRIKSAACTLAWVDCEA